MAGFIITLVLHWYDLCKLYYYYFYYQPPNHPHTVDSAHTNAQEMPIELSATMARMNSECGRTRRMFLCTELDPTDAVSWWPYNPQRLNVEYLIVVHLQHLHGSTENVPLSQHLLLVIIIPVNPGKWHCIMMCSGCASRDFSIHAATHSLT